VAASSGPHGEVGERHKVMCILRHFRAIVIGDAQPRDYGHVGHEVGKVDKGAA
jgi:hypothetical protein